MMSCCSNKGCAAVCKILFFVVAVAELAALVGLYQAHFGVGGATFGSTTGSLSIVALAVNTVVLLKLGMMHCESCSKKM